MGHKESEQLAEMLIEAKAVVSVLRGLHKDLTATVREANEILDQTADKRVEALLHKKVKEAYALLDASQDRNLRNIAESLNSAWKAFGQAVFGPGVDAKYAAAVAVVVKEVVAQFGGRNGVLKIVPREAEQVFGRLISGGLPTIEHMRNGKVNPLIKPTIGATPHASVQDTRTDVV